MNLEIIIPTFNRIGKLDRCLKSIEAQTYRDFNVNIYCDSNDIKTYEWICNNHIHQKSELFIRYVEVNKKQEFVTGSWNKGFKKFIKETNSDAVVLLVDDVELYPNYLEELVKSVQSNFPDLDGVIGAKQECPNHSTYTFKWFGQTLIGRKFIERYKEVDYAVWCTDYNHFYPDEEMWMFANELGKFKNCETAVLKHYHPAFVKSELDETHPLVRGRVKRVDDGTYSMRRKQGLVWGSSWELVNK